MSDGINETNSKNIDDYEDFRFRDAAQAIFFKYQMTDNLKHSDEIIVATTSVHMAHDRQQTTVKSQACIIL
jgi:hypothetical protein